jgi:hypothetical protein
MDCSKYHTAFQQKQVRLFGNDQFKAAKPCVRGTEYFGGLTTSAPPCLCNQLYIDAFQLPRELDVCQTTKVVVLSGQWCRSNLLAPMGFWLISH